MQVSIGHCIIENENRVTGRSKIPQECKIGIFGQHGDTYAVVGRPSNLVVDYICRISIERSFCTRPEASNNAQWPICIMIH